MSDPRKPHDDKKPEKKTTETIEYGELPDVESKSKPKLDTSGYSDMSGAKVTSKEPTKKANEQTQKKESSPTEYGELPKQPDLSKYDDMSLAKKPSSITKPENNNEPSYDSIPSVETAKQWKLNASKTQVESAPQQTDQHNKPDHYGEIPKSKPYGEIPSMEKAKNMKMQQHEKTAPAPIYGSIQNAIKKTEPKKPASDHYGDISPTPKTIEPNVPNERYSSIPSPSKTATKSKESTPVNAQTTQLQRMKILQDARKKIGSTSETQNESKQSTTPSQNLPPPPNTESYGNIGHLFPVAKKNTSPDDAEKKPGNNMTTKKPGEH